MTYSFCPCFAGYYCPLGTNTPTPCEAGKYQNHTGSTSCITCPAGYYCTVNTSDPIECPAGYYCFAGAKVGTDNPCPKGTFSNITARSVQAECQACTPG